MGKLEGLVTRTQSGYFTVQTPSGEFTCRLRGRLRRGPREEDLAAIGDRVGISVTGTETGMIDEVLPRTRALVRKAPTARGEYMQVIVANPDQAVFVFACQRPAPRLGMLDRFLVIAEKQEIPGLIVANKIDLVGEEEARALFGIYEQIGYQVIYTSARSGEGLERLRRELQGRVSVLSGPSGVGKSSLLNAMQPGLGLEVKTISQATSKGRHTTVVRELFALAGGGYVADTPGIRALALWDIEPEELDGYFPEMRSRVAECEYNDCTHSHEPNCAIQRAVEQGEIPASRYRSYLRLRAGDEDD
jgi:ribosome biogenesis GTPase / thiamine phosphate phosphatase